MGDTLTKGAGTPWGPMESGRPDRPNYEQYDTDLSKYMQGPEVEALREAFALQGGDAGRQYMAAQSKMLGSGTTSGSNAGRLANIAALTQKGTNAATLAAAKEQMDAFNRARDARNRLLAQQYGADANAYGQEQQARGSAIGGLLGGGANVLGSYLGGL